MTVGYLGGTGCIRLPIRSDGDIPSYMHILRKEKGDDMTITVVQEELLKDSLIRSVIFTASSRDIGLVFRVTSICGTPTDQEITIKDGNPSRVVQLDDGRIGFHVRGISYITATAQSGEKFYKWISYANEKAVRKIDYGQPRCIFHRCS